MKSIKEVAKHLDHLGWRYQMDEKRNTILSGASGDNGTYMMIITLQQNNTLLILMPCAKASGLPKSKLAELDETLLNLNYRLAVGAFERDSSDGDIRFRVGFPAEDGPSREQMTHMLMAVCLSVDKHSPEIQRLIHGGNAPKFGDGPVVV